MNSIQLDLFKSLPIVAIKTGEIIVSKTVAIEEIDHPLLKKLPKGKFKIHSTGGFHFFSDVENADPIFKKQIWPWVEVVKETKRNTRKYMIFPRVMVNKGLYCEITLLGEGFNVKIKMHKLVCLAFKKNPNPETHLLVNHINGWKPDYRVENLEWTTHADNSTGPTIESRLPNDITYKIWQLSLNKKEEAKENEIIEMKNDN